MGRHWSDRELHRDHLLVAHTRSQHPDLRRGSASRNGNLFSRTAAAMGHLLEPFNNSSQYPPLAHRRGRARHVHRRCEPRHADHRREPRVRLLADARLLPDRSSPVRRARRSAGRDLRARLAATNRAIPRLHARRPRDSARRRLDVVAARQRGFQSSPHGGLRRPRSRCRPTGQGAVSVLPSGNSPSSSRARRMATVARSCPVRCSRARGRGALVHQIIYPSSPRSPNWPAPNPALSPATSRRRCRPPISSGISGARSTRSCCSCCSYSFIGGSIWTIVAVVRQRGMTGPKAGVPGWSLRGVAGDHAHSTSRLALRHAADALSGGDRYRLARPSPARHRAWRARRVLVLAVLANTLEHELWRRGTRSKQSSSARHQTPRRIRTASCSTQIRGFLVAGPQRDGDMPGLFKALREEGVEVVAFNSQPDQNARISRAKGFGPLAMIAKILPSVEPALANSSAAAVARHSSDNLARACRRHVRR